MKKSAILLIALILFSFDLYNNEETYSLIINVNELRNSKGVVQFSIYNKEGSIPDEKYKRYYKKDIALINNGSSTITFSDLPKGKYAINILHDENENGKVDKGFMLPKEGIGFSNYQSIGLRNRPKFSKASFELNETMIKNIKIIYF